LWFKLAAMPVVDLYENEDQSRNLAHFAALASLAARDGIVTDEEKVVLDRFAMKLGITDEQYAEVMKEDNKYPITTTGSAQKRLARLYDLFTMVFSDHSCEVPERALLERYAIGLGYSVEQAERMISRAFDIFCGKIEFEEFEYLIGRKLKK